MSPRPGWYTLFVAALGAALIGSACGSVHGNSNGSAGDAADAAAAGDDASAVLGGDGSLLALTISPQDPTMHITGPGSTLQFTALIGGNPTPASWTIDSALGTIDGTGLFTAKGVLGGSTMVDAQVGNQHADTLLTVDLTLGDNPGNVDPGTQTKLRGGGTADPAFAWLYPYDGTVFPRGIAPPLLQTGGTGFDAAMLHVQFSTLSYTGFYGPSTPGRIQLTPQLWKAISEGASASDTVSVQITKIHGGQVTGPITEHWTIAPGTLRGTVYYDSYNSVLAGNTGAIMSVRPGQTAKVVIAGCRVCHSVSADGSTLVAANEVPNATATDRVWDLQSNLAPLHDAPNRTWAFGALYPDGSRLLRFGVVPDSQAAGEYWSPNVRGLGQSGDLPSALFNPRTGAAIPAPGLDGQGLHMMMPTFAPDGKMVAFNHYDTGHGHTLAVMDFDATTNTFSNLRDIATVSSGYLGWPAFTPDDQYVIFAAGDNAEYDSVSDQPSVVPQPHSDLYVANVGSKTTAMANQLDGLTAAGQVYLPFGEAAEGHLNYEPTVLPEAVGGYFWVVFTSRREYGNTLNDPDPYNLNGQPGARKKLWVAAVDIASTVQTQAKIVPFDAAKDVTHPAFYLDGQELASGNMRGFWALDPCQNDGAGCATGDQCCSGFCRQTSGADGGTTFACTPAAGCAQEGERCTTAADCCGAQSGTQCIAGFCATTTPK